MGAHSVKITLGLVCRLSKGIQSFIIRASFGLQKRWEYDHTKHFHVQQNPKSFKLTKIPKLPFILISTPPTKPSSFLFYFVFKLPHLYSGVVFSCIAYVWAGYDVLVVGTLTKLIIWRNNCRTSNSCTNTRNQCLY